MRRVNNATLEAVILLASDLAEEEVIARLLRDGCTVTRAWKLVVLVPMAFARAVFEPAGVRFYNYYHVQMTGGCTVRRRRLSAEPLYGEALKLARRLAGSRRVAALFQVIKRSPDFTAIQQLHRAGSQLRSIKLREPKLLLCT